MTAPATPLPDAALPLAGKRIAVPESRLLDVLAGLLTRRGADVYRCPLVSIIDTPDSGPVLDWLYGFIADTPEFFVVMTGEGLARLRSFANDAGIGAEKLRAALQATTLISRGPKPARELRRFGLTPDHFAPEATTAGVIECLKGLKIRGQRVAVQLYGDEPNEMLMSFLRRRACRVTTVAPYRYAPRLSQGEIAELIGRLQSRSLDAIVFTSKSQVSRLFSAARDNDMLPQLRQGLSRTCVAAIGPVVADALVALGHRPDLVPDDRYFMKPLVSLLAETL